MLHYFTDCPRARIGPKTLAAFMDAQNSGPAFEGLALPRAYCWQNSGPRARIYALRPGLEFLEELLAAVSRF